MIPREAVEKYEEVRSQVESLYQELGALAKKSPDSPINLFKLRIINEKLDVANGMLTGLHRPFATFERFEEDTLPTASDVALVLAQYISSLEGWRSANVIKKQYTWIWDTEEQDYKAAQPTRFRDAHE